MSPRRAGSPPRGSTVPQPPLLPRTLRPYVAGGASPRKEGPQPAQPGASGEPSAASLAPLLPPINGAKNGWELPQEHAGVLVCLHQCFVSMRRRVCSCVSREQMTTSLKPLGAAAGGCRCVCVCCCPHQQHTSMCVCVCVCV